MDNKCPIYMVKNSSCSENYHHWIQSTWMVWMYKSDHWKSKSYGQCDTNECSWKFSKMLHFPNKLAFCLLFSTLHLSPILKTLKFKKTIQHVLISPSFTHQPP